MTYSLKGLVPSQPYQVQSGVTYTPNSAGVVASVPAGPDLANLEAQGGQPIDSSLSPAANGLFVTRLPLTSGRNSDFTGLGAGATGKFTISLSAGTSALLTTEAANNGTKTDTVAFEHVLPRNYDAASNLTITATAYHTPGAGTVGTHTLAAHAYKCADDGTQGSDIVATSAATVPATTAADLAFTVTGTTLNPGDRIVITLVAVIQETMMGGNVTSTIGGVRLS